MNQQDQHEYDAGDDVNELLTTYLDDELTPDERARVEERLSHDDQFRGRLAELQRAWDLLDALPRSAATHDFTKSTVEMVAVKARSGSESTQIVRKRWWLAYALGIGAGVIAAAGGFTLVYSALDAPNRRIVEDLTLLQRLDDYRYADSVEFLEELDEAGLFAAEEEAADDSL